MAGFDLGGFARTAFSKMRSGGSPGFIGEAVNDLFGGSALRDQVAGETDEMRKKRMQQTQERSLMGPYGSLAAYSLFGGGEGGGQSR